MKDRIRIGLSLILKKLAQVTVLRYKPAIVGVTGSVGKTGTVRAITAVLSEEKRVRASHGNFNGEIGIPLTILGDWREKDLKLLSREYGPGENTLRKILFLLKVIVVSAWRLAMRAPYPEVLVLEYGIDRPGDMKRLVRIARPNVAVMTAVGDTPAHVEFFSGPQEVVREKARLIECVPAAGAAVLNADDESLMALTPRTRAEVVTFGFAGGATVAVEGFEYRVEEEMPHGVAFKLRRAGALVPVRLDGALGRSQAYAASAAAAVGLIFGLNLVSIAGGLEKRYRPAAHRMQVLPGLKASTLLDDSYNASPLSMQSALEALRSLPAKRRIAVLGDMLEIGEYAMAAHEKMGHAAAECADMLVLIGPRAKFIGEGARAKGFDMKDILSFETAAEAREPLEKMLKKGDLVLLKGSHAMDLESLVNALKEEPVASATDAAIV